MSVFDPRHPPSYGTPVSTAFRTLENEFGDGYDQTVPDGLNNVRETWEVSWANIPEADANEIEASLIAFAGASFEWQTPRGSTKRFKCQEVNNSFVRYRTHNVTATFVESFS